MRKKDFKDEDEEFNYINNHNNHNINNPEEREQRKRRKDKKRDKKDKKKKDKKKRARELRKHGQEQGDAIPLLYKSDEISDVSDEYANDQIIEADIKEEDSVLSGDSLS